MPETNISHDDPTINSNLVSPKKTDISNDFELKSNDTSEILSVSTNKSKNTTENLPVSISKFNDSPEELSTSSSKSKPDCQVTASQKPDCQVTASQKPDCHVTASQSHVTASQLLQIKELLCDEEQTAIFRGVTATAVDADGRAAVFPPSVRLALLLHDANVRERVDDSVTHLVCLRYVGKGFHLVH